MSDDAADVLRAAIDGKRTASDAWEDQQAVNESISASVTDIRDVVLTDDVRAAGLTEGVAETVERRLKNSDA